MSRLLSDENKRNRVVDSKVILALCRRNPDKFERRYITVDETWMHRCTPETKEQSKQSNEEVIAQIDGYFEDLPKSYFLNGLKKLEKRLEKCTELKGDYVEA